MSRLSSRLARLERELGGCPACASRQVEILLCGPNDPRPVAGAQSCELCSEPIEQLVVLLAYDPHDPGERP